MKGNRMKETLAKRVLIAAATIAVTISMSACSTGTNEARPTTTTLGSSAPEASQATGCEVNPASAPVPTAERFEVAPADGRISVTISGLPSGIFKLGDPPAEVEVTLCNNSPVDYPQVGVVFALERCSCATSPHGLPDATADRFDPSTGKWIPLSHPVMGTGADYLGAYENVQALPKGKSVTLRYRFAVDPSMTAGKGSVGVTAVIPDAIVQIGKASLPFDVWKYSPKDPTPPSSVPGPTPRQSVLGFTGLTSPSNMAVTGAGDVYVADTFSNRVVKLAAGSNEQTVLPFTGLDVPAGLAVNDAGDVFVADSKNDRVLKLAAGSTKQTVPPFTGLDSPRAVAVDTGGNVYVAETNNRVLKLAAGSNEQTVLALTGLAWAGDVAVDNAGDVYVSDPPNKRILKLVGGSGEPIELRVGARADGFAVDSAGDVYVPDVENKQVRKYSAQSVDSTTLPFAGLNGPAAVAVDGAGNVYVIDDSGFGRVVKLAAG
jgi:sugar lactone lactonase YvrE